MQFKNETLLVLDTLHIREARLGGTLDAIQPEGAEVSLPKLRMWVRNGGHTWIRSRYIEKSPLRVRRRNEEGLCEAYDHRSADAGFGFM
jgi:hypothetical protein